MTLNRRALVQALAALSLGGALPDGLQAGDLAVQASLQRARKRRRILVPRVNGGVNLHPIRRLDSVSDFSPPLIVPDLVAAQMRAVYELGYRSVRVTLSFNEFGPDFFGAIPYVRAARALGIDVLGIIDQFGLGFDLLRALMDPRRRARVLRAYVEVFDAPVTPAAGVERCGGLAFQVLNEPGESRGISAEQYVRYLLAPSREDLARLRPGIPVVAAAPAGHRAGLLRLRSLLAAGLERVCDVVALHIYDRQLIAPAAEWVRGRVRVTETGVRGPHQHLAWQLEAIPQIRAAIPQTEEVYWFDLLDGDPGGFRLLAWDADPTGSPRVAVQSPDLEAWLRGQVLVATGGAPLLDFARVIPDVAPYLPTAADFAAAEAGR